MRITSLTTVASFATAHNPLYNGNIAHTVNSLQPWGGWTAPTQPAQVLGQVYKYDQLNRLKKAQGVEELTVAANSWEGVTDAEADRYKSAYTYDANGNIKSTERWDDAGTQYDDFAYKYHTAGGSCYRTGCTTFMMTPRTPRVRTSWRLRARSTTALLG